MSELRACKKCQLVSKKVTLYHHEVKWLGGSEYLCEACQKSAFHVWIKLSLIAIFSVNNKTKRDADIMKLITRARALAKNNKITEDYCIKAMAHEVKLYTKKTT